jgi:uncharacterized membrane protein YoaK (UPF0700 family)
MAVTKTEPSVVAPKQDPESLQITPGTPSTKRGFRTFLNESIREDIFLEIQLLLLAFATGIQDATTYPDYFCFASNQTGNTVLLAIGVSGLAGGAFSFGNIGVSLSMFLTGGWVAGLFGNLFNPRRRAWLLVSSLVQTLMVWVAVILQYNLPVARTGTTAYLVLSLLAFSSAAQVAMARSLKMTEITTAMATAAYVDLFIDPDLYKLHNRKRNRRAIFLTTLAAGSFAGAYCNKGVNSAFALMISAVLKTVAMLALFFNKPENQFEEQKNPEPQGKGD